MTRDKLPVPPPDLGARSLPVVVLPGGTHLFRIHRSAQPPLFFGPPGPMAESRFDDPDGHYKVGYFGFSAEACLVETLLRSPRRLLSWAADIEVRSIAEFETVEAIRAVDSGGSGFRLMGATLEVLGTRESGLSGRWSRALWAHASEPDAIRYACRHDNHEMGLALFDRAADRVRLLATAPLAQRGTWLGQMSTRYDFGLTT